MKHLLLLLAFLESFSASTSQTPSISQTASISKVWFYNIPLTTKSAEIRSFLKSDKRFIEDLSKGQDSTILGYSTFSGYIVEPELPSGLLFDSSRVSLTIGLGTYTIQKKPIKGYAGPYKVIAIEYFLSDTAKLNNLYNTILTDLRMKAKVTINDMLHSTAGSYQSQGAQLIYLNTRKNLFKIELWKMSYKNFANSIRIECEASEN